MRTTQEVTKARERTVADRYRLRPSTSGQRRKRGFQYFDIASVMVKDSGELHTINICKDWYNLRQGERKERVVNGRPWNLQVSEKRSRGRSAAGLGARGKLKESYYQAKQDYYQRNSVVQQIIMKSLEFIRRPSCQLKHRKESHCRTCALVVTDPRLKITSGGSRRCMVTATRR